MHDFLWGAPGGHREFVGGTCPPGPRSYAPAPNPDDSPPRQLPSRTTPHLDNSPPGHSPGQFSTRTTPHPLNHHRHTCPGGELPYIQGGPRKNATTLIVNFKNIVDETDFCLFVEHSFSNKMTCMVINFG